MTAEYVTTRGGVRIAYDVVGQGPGLVLLHGAGKTRKDWHSAGYVSRLREDFRVVCVDIRGSGESDYLTRIEDYAVEEIVGDLEVVADACGVEQYGI
jgi:pimeloyl-ACP methyl ester carboxylesterase